jgi:hypothetical protein
MSCPPAGGLEATGTLEVVGNGEGGAAAGGALEPCTGDLTLAETRSALHPSTRMTTRAFE